MEIPITFFFKETKKGFTSKCDFFELSIHKGLWAWAKSKEVAKNKLVDKWNKKVDADYENLLNNIPENVTVSKINLQLSK